MNGHPLNPEDLLEKSKDVGVVWFDSFDTFIAKGQEAGMFNAEAVALVVWELLTTQLLHHNVEGPKLRVILMELQDDMESEQMDLFDL